jgi:TonB family protein
LTTISQADFFDAQKNYQDGNFAAAYKEYLTLAKFGHIKSQYNIAVMLTKGQGVKQDLIKAYAWSKTSDSDNNKLTNIIVEGLSETDLVAAKKLTDNYFNQFSQSSAKVLIGPTINTTKNDGNKNSNAIELVSIHKTPPIYPKALAMKRISGLVDLMFNVYPDGSAKDIQVVVELPANSFAKSAVKSIETYKYSFKKNGIDTEISEPISVTTRISYKMAHSEPTNELDLTKKQQQLLKDMIDKANDGDINAQYSYAIVFETLLRSEGDIPAEKVNQWLFNVAQSGNTDAQYRLGKNIYYGKACEIEKQKGLDWIMHAAQMGNSDAEYMAYQMLQNDKVINQSNQAPLYWLEQAANNGSKIAQLRLAKEIVTSSSPSDNQLKKASTYLKEYSKSSYKTIQWYQTNALLMDKLNKHSKALSSMKTAMRKAKKSDWDLTELLEQQAMIKKNKNS